MSEMIVDVFLYALAVFAVGFVGHSMSTGAENSKKRARGHVHDNKTVFSESMQDAESSYKTMIQCLDNADHAIIHMNYSNKQLKCDVLKREIEGKKKARAQLIDEIKKALFRQS